MVTASSPTIIASLLDNSELSQAEAPPRNVLENIPRISPNTLLIEMGRARAPVLYSGDKRDKK